MMKRLLLIFLAVLAFLVTLLVLASPTWLDAGLQRNSRGLVGLAEAKGSLWRGTGVIQAILPSGQVETLEAVRWTIDPWALLTARLHLAMLSERDGKPVLDALFSPGGVSIAELRLEAPAAMLGALSPTLRAATVTGRISLQASGVRFDKETTVGSGVLLWHDAGSSLTSVYPLGSYLVNMKGAGAGVEFTLTSLGGALNLAGGGQWQPDKPLSFQAIATPVPDRARQMAPLLRILGKEIGGDRYQIVLDSSTGLASR
jgi:hypothetical protein